jgi:type III secretion system FlhB-like substrate exporter
LPFASELPIALALLALALVGGQPIAAFGAAFRHFARAAWGGQLSLAQASAALPGLLQPLFVLLAIPALAALACIVAQRAPTLQSSPDNSSAQEQGRGRPGHGRSTRAWLTALKVLVLGASLLALVYGSAAGWLATTERSADDLLAISGRVLPAVLVRAAWVCLLLAGLELTVQYISRMRRLRMTRQQLQDEQRELVGDPRLLAERRSRAHATDVPVRLSPQLIAADLAQLSAAALLITGTSCVVALEYTPERGLPRVWLRAEGNHALELLSRAYNLDLPIVHDELLAASLFRRPLRASIPSEWHARVAQWLVDKGVAQTREVS